MKLEKFLECSSFAKYRKTISSIREEFISKDCEKFLWKSFDEQKAARDYTDKLLVSNREVECNPYVEAFIEQFFQIDVENEIEFVFPEDYSTKYIMAREICRHAKKLYILTNLIPDDETVNWIAVFNKADKYWIRLMHTITYGTALNEVDQYGGYKLFGSDLKYYASLLQYQGHLLYSYTYHFQGNLFRPDTNPFIILNVRKTVQSTLCGKYFKNELDLYYNLHKVLLPFLQAEFDDSLECLASETDDYKTVCANIKELKNRLIAEGKISSKWKMETSLYSLVKKVYNDAIYQYYPDWLRPQSLDIYIPSLNIAIEYQGIQHYENVSFFGGEKEFIHRQELDEKKRKLCAENKVHLIEWPYTDEVNYYNLKDKINKLAI